MELAPLGLNEATKVVVVAYTIVKLPHIRFVLVVGHIDTVLEEDVFCPCHVVPLFVGKEERVDGHLFVSNLVPLIVNEKAWKLFLCLAPSAFRVTAFAGLGCLCDDVDGKPGHFAVKS